MKVFIFYDAMARIVCHVPWPYEDDPFIVEAFDRQNPPHQMDSCGN